MSEIGKPFSRKVVHQLLLILIAVAVIGFIVIMTTSNPADLRKEKEKEAAEAALMAMKKGSEEEAKRKIEEEMSKARRDVEARERLERERKEREEEEFARLMGGNKPSEVPPPMPMGAPVAFPADDESTRIMASAASDSAAATAKLDVYENYGKTPLPGGIVLDAVSDGQWREHVQDDPRIKGGEFKGGNARNVSGRSVDAKMAAYDTNKPKVSPSKLLVAEGSLIRAVLLTAINSQLPGSVQARVTHDVYDSITGTRLLIPRGSRLLGEYASVVLANCLNQLILPLS